MVHLSLIKEDPMLSPSTRPIRDLLPGLPILMKIGSTNIKISQITHNSKDVMPRSLFVAIRGYAVDGHTFIPEAIHRGASCIVLEDPSWIPPRPPALFIQVANSRKALALLASNYQHNPTRKLTLIGITGTNGKTTLTYLLESILNRANIPSGVIGTINYRFGSKTIEAKTTTPDPLILQEILSEMLASGVRTVSMEVSSHALSLHRVEGCHFDLAVWTNLSQDHLDFHHTMEDYFKAKEALFTHHLSISAKQNKGAVINIDDKYGKRLTRSLSSFPILTYGRSPKADVHPIKTELSSSETSLSVQTPKGIMNIKSNLIGYHNQMNILSAIATSVALNLPNSAIIKGLRNVIVPGRLQPIYNSLNIGILVDYAHTPDALENALKSIKHLTNGRIITVFGCGGDRDRGKRPMMGSIAERLSNLVIITNDNPRTEDPSTILSEIEAGIQDMPLVSEEALTTAPRGYLKTPDRKQAIYLAIQSASPGDIVLIAGKGHEPYQIIGTTKIPFLDANIAREAVRKKAGTKG